ncbi:MAG: transposase family protein, partial [Acidobacteria bacterium]|nr:transposase family protein [Acidobacteriota bacterium]
MDVTTLLADPAAIHLECFVSEPNSITLVIHTIQQQPSCPKCNSPSTSLHSHYQRVVADLPWHGVAVKLELHTRKLRCRNELCKQKVFCERLPKVVDVYARKTVRLNDALTLLAFALGGEAGARAAHCLSLSVSGDTLLRRIRRYALPQTITPRVLGVDDW